MWIASAVKESHKKVFILFSNMCKTMLFHNIAFVP